MTNEEQIDWLCRLRTDLNNGVIFTPWNKEFIEALNGVLDQGPIGDCVSREDAINALRKAFYNYEDKTEKQFKESKKLNLEDWFQHRIFVQNMNDIDVKTILKLPPVHPKTGHWEDCSNGWMCSNCCRDVSHESDFCPHCGADMRKSEGCEIANEEETREMMTADERALFLNKLTHWLNDNFNDIVIGGWQDTDGEIFDLFFIRRDKND